MKKKLLISGKQIKLDQSQLIQSGGEGMVFKWQDTAVKLYHQPTAQHQAKIRYFLQHGLAAQMPTAVLAPCQEVMDENGRFIGFQMPLLPTNSQPIKRLSNPIFCQKQNHTLEKIIPLLQHTHTTLTQLHKYNIIIGDLNDTNIYFTQHALRTTLFIDVDSYQFAHYPCPVAMPAFLDPNLYSVSDFGLRPCFSEQTDWYAFTVLLVKTLLGVHPYGGTHPTHKTLQARASAHVSILNTAVTYPQNARPRDTLSDDLLHHLHRVFELGERPSFPADLVMNAVRGSVIGNRYSVIGKKPLRTTHYALRELFATAGFIEHVALSPHGRIQAIVFADEQYKLVRLGIGGKLDEMVLFNGRVGYRFALFGKYLVVNPPERQQLLILDVSGSQPQQVTMIETAVFQETAVFAATPQHLYRIAGNWIMRGSVQHGHYVEETIGSAHQNQTWFKASPYADTIAGLHRIFAENRYFVQSPQGSFDLQLPPLAAQEFITDSRFAFGRDTVALGLTLKSNGRVSHKIHTFSHSGQHLHTQPANETAVNLRSYPVTQLPEAVSDTAVTYQHPSGLLIQEISRLLFFAQN